LQSEEFQLVVPPSLKQLQGAELSLAEARWPAVLETLYRAPPSLLEQEFAALFHQDEVMAVAVAPSVDKVSRTSLVAVCSTSTISWNTEDIADRLAKLKSLVARLSKSYGTAFRGADERVRSQLRAGAFLPDRRFSLTAEKPDKEWPWLQVVSEVRKWKGISGIATPGLCALGANVLYGTRDEFERHRSTSPLAGFFDVARGQIQPEGDRLTPWVPKPESPVREARPASAQRTDAERLDEIAAALSEVKSEVHALRSGLNGWFERLYTLVERAIKKRH